MKEEGLEYLLSIPFRIPVQGREARHSKGTRRGDQLSIPFRIPDETGAWHEYVCSRWNFQFLSGFQIAEDSAVEYAATLYFLSIPFRIPGYFTLCPVNSKCK